MLTLKARHVFSMVLISGAAVALCGPFATGQERATAVTYTAAQAMAGRAAYQETCAACHLADLHGSNEAPPLAGVNFVNTWRNRTTSDLFNRIQTTMPPYAPGSI